MRYDNEEWVLSSGRRMYGFTDVIGISADANYLAHGDGALEILEPDPTQPNALVTAPFTHNERQEIAEHMIALWQRWRDQTSA